MKKAILAALALATALGACASPEQTAINRAAHMAKLFPNPADREGIYLVFPIGNSLLVDYFPAQVTKQQILDRVASFCTNPVQGDEAITEGTKPAPDGTIMPSRSFVIDCDNSFS